MLGSKGRGPSEMRGRRPESNLGGGLRSGSRVSGCGWSRVAWCGIALVDEGCAMAGRDCLARRGRISHVVSDQASARLACRDCERVFYSARSVEVTIGQRVKISKKTFGPSIVAPRRPMTWPRFAAARVRANHIGAA